jgi:hypothetical protein
LISGYFFFFIFATIIIIFPCKGYYGILSDYGCGCILFLFKCRRKFGFGGLLAKDSPRLCFFGASLIELHVDIFSGSCGRMGAFSLPPFSFSASVMAKL